MMADYVAMLFEGAIIAYGTVDEDPEIAQSASSSSSSRGPRSAIPI